MDNDKSKYTLRNFIYMMIIVFVVWSVYGFVIYNYIGKWDGPGTFGDMFGAVNALFSGFAFAGIIFTILLQKEELRLQREELKLTRNELKRTASAQEISQQALSEQAETLQATARINTIIALMDIYQRHGDTARADMCKKRLEGIVGNLEKDSL